MNEAAGIFDRSSLHRFLVPVLIGFVTWFLPAPEGLDPRGWKMLAVFVATMAGIVMAPLPMAAVAIIGAVVASLVGVLDFAEVDVPSRSGVTGGPRTPASPRCERCRSDSSTYSGKPPQRIS